MITKDNPDQLVPADDLILADVWDALWKEDAIRSMDMGSLSINVKGGEVYLNGYLPRENNLPLIESIARSVVGVLDVHNHLRTNDSILVDIWDALWRNEIIRSLDIDSLSINVKDGEVYLYGYLTRDDNLVLIENIARSTEGVVEVHNNLVLDRDLTIQVAQALSRDERTRIFILPVYAFHGWIHICGEVPTRELQHVVEQVAGGVSNVRGVIALPRAAGECPSISKRTVQPHVGAVVYGENGVVGVITQVVVQPNNRLVTHIVIRFNELSDGNLGECKKLIPVEAIFQSNKESIFLTRNGSSLNAYPTFDPDKYTPAPFTWKTPYPYTAGEVLWSFRDILEAESRPSRPEIKAVMEIERAPEQVLVHAGV